MPGERILATGASGRLGAVLREHAAMTSRRLACWSGPTTRDPGLRPVEITDPRGVETALAADDPSVVIHAAAVSAAGEAYRDPERARKVNVEATARVADWCVRHHRRLILVSTDLVFDGTGSWRTEDDLARPVMVYGQTKRAAEMVLEGRPGCLSARMSLLYGPTPSARGSFFDQAIASLRSGVPQAFFTDEFRTPLDYATAARVLLMLATTHLIGIVHVGGPERMSRHEHMRQCAIALGIDPTLALPNQSRDVPSAEPRPLDVSLDSSRLLEHLPDLRRPTVRDALAAR